MEFVEGIVAHKCYGASYTKMKWAF